MRSADAVLSQLFEGAPAFVARLMHERSDSPQALLDRAEEIAAGMPETDQIELLNGHPRIGALPSTVSAISFREQGYDRDPGTAELQKRLDQLNDDYERRFGFRFVVFVAGRPRSEIADVMKSRLDAPRKEELKRGLSDVFSIARNRLEMLGRTAEEAR